MTVPCLFFFEGKKNLTLIQKLRVHNCSVPVFFLSSRFLTCHGMFDETVHAFDLSVLLGTKDSVFLTKLYLRQ